MTVRAEVERYLSVRHQWDQVVRNEADRGDLYERLTAAWFSLTQDERRIAGVHCCLTYH